MRKAFKNLKIEPSEIKSRVNETLNADSSERKIYMKYKLLKTAGMAAAITSLLVTTALAVSPEGREAIGDIISYFASDKAEEMTCIEELSKYNEEIGRSISKDGYTLTLDNVAADDNYVHVFYTIKSDSIPFYEGDDINAAIYSDAVNTNVDTEVVIDGVLAGYGTNHNRREGYFLDNYTYKAAYKFNIAAKNISDNFTIELFADIGGSKENPAFTKLYNNEYAAINDTDKAGLWYIAADVDKSTVKTATVTKEINTALPWLGVTVEKAMFSPFGNQLIVSTPPDGDPDAALRSDMFALYNENGTCLDILNTDLCGSYNGFSRNTIEFLKADKNIKQLKFVPIRFYEHGDADVIEKNIGEYPLEFDVSDYGKVIVTDIRINDGRVEIDYYKDGFILFDPGFILMDDNGNNAEPGGKLGCTLYTDVHYDTNSYTARYEYEKYSDDGKPIPPDDSVSAEALKKSITMLGVIETRYFSLDFENAVNSELK